MDAHEKKDHWTRNRRLQAQAVCARAARTCRRMSQAAEEIDSQEPRISESQQPNVLLESDQQPSISSKSYRQQSISAGSGQQPSASAENDQQPRVSMESGSISVIGWPRRARCHQEIQVTSLCACQQMIQIGNSDACAQLRLNTFLQNRLVNLLPLCYRPIPISLTPLLCFVSVQQAHKALHYNKVTV